MCNSQKTSCLERRIFPRSMLVSAPQRPWFQGAALLQRVAAAAFHRPANKTTIMRPTTNICKSHFLRAVISVIVTIQLCWIVTSSRSLALQEGHDGRVETTVLAPPFHSENHQRTITSTRQTIPVFYNLYVNPDNVKDVPRVQKLVQEQLSMLRQSNHHHPVFVKSIGRPMNIPNTTLLGHYQKGSEMLTLHSLWKYCQSHTQDSVMYLHSKGSFHDRPENDLLRNLMTRGAVECSHHQPPSCHVCSSRFSPYPHPHTSGNMWLARCEYVTKLIDPLYFANRMEDVPRAPGLKRRLEYYLVGRERFAAEHWIYSHPDGRPCDLYKGNFSCGYDNLPMEIRVHDDFDLQLAPRFPYKFYRPLKELTPWTGLRHRLKEYSVLYNATPTDSWWGWDIDEWRQERDNGTLLLLHNK